MIAEELGPPEEVFAEISPTPLGAASIAQTYLARLPGGEEVVVEVQRPGRGPVDRSRPRHPGAPRRPPPPGRTGWAKALGLRQLVAGFEERTREELDFRIEDADLEAARRSLTTRTRCAHPRPPGRASRRRGSSCRGARPAGASPRRGRSMAGTPTAVRPWPTACWPSRCARCSGASSSTPIPTPGNIFLRPDGQLELIDFGAVGRLDPYERAGLIDVLQALQTDDPSLMREGLLRIGAATGSVSTRRRSHRVARACPRPRRPPRRDAEPWAVRGPPLRRARLRDPPPRSTLTLFRHAGHAARNPRGDLAGVPPRGGRAAGRYRPARGAVGDPPRPRPSSSRARR